jgi:omega-hydroxy-beta-dihydromenaquinone-9 sulfotransferase
MKNTESDDTTPIDRPIFVIGTGRSGTTLRFKILSRHPELGWIRTLSASVSLSYSQHLRKGLGKLPGCAWLRRTSFYAVAHPEPYAFWQRYAPSFNRPCRDLDERDVHPHLASGIRSALMNEIRELKRTRFITKYTGWSRIRFMDQIFPDALYVHIIRNGLDVAWSLLQQDFWEGWRGPGQWRWGPLAPADREIWEQSDRSFFVLAGLQWKLLMENITQTGAQVHDRYKEIRYEDLVNNPDSTVASLLQFADLPNPPKFMAWLNAEAIKSSKGKWRAVHSKEINDFEKHLYPVLQKYGYA